MSEKLYTQKELDEHLNIVNKNLQNKINSLERSRELGRQGAENLVAQIEGLQNIITDLLFTIEYDLMTFQRIDNKGILNCKSDIEHLTSVIDRVKKRKSDEGYIPFCRGEK